MKRMLAAALLAALIGTACGGDDKETGPSANSNDVRFTAQLLPANENPTVVGAETSGSGVVNITVHITRDASKTITAANADFTVALSGFPAGTSLNNAHIHRARAGIVGPTINNLGITAGDFVLTNGSLTFTKTAVNFVSLDDVQNMINDPAGFYFNVHSVNNSPGVARGQLVAQ